MTRIRRTKTLLYVVQIALIFGIAIFLLETAGEFSLKPLFLPINSFIYFVILMGIIFTIESFIFKRLEIRFTDSISSKYYMAKMASRRAMVIIAIALIVILLLWLPPVTNSIEGALITESMVNGTSSFYNKDPLGLTATEKVTLRAQGGEAQVYVVSEEYYLAYSNNMDSLRFFRINAQNYVVNSEVTFAFPEGGYEKFYVITDDRYSSAEAVSYTLHQDLSPTFMDFVPLFALLFIVTNAAWIAYLIPLRKRYSVGAIYK